MTLNNDTINWKPAYLPIIMLIILGAMAFSRPTVLNNQSAERFLIDFNVEIKTCKNLANDSQQISCLEKLTTNSKEELAEIEDALGLIEFQRKNVIEPKGYLLNAKSHFEKAYNLNPNNKQYRNDLDAINELIENKF